MLIKPLFQKTQSDSILCEIEQKVLQWSKLLLGNIRFGLDNKINLVDFDNLMTLREIYLSNTCDKKQVKLLINQITNKNC